MCRCAPIFSESSGLGLYKPVRSVGSIRVRDFSVLQLCIGAQSFDRFFLVKWGGGDYISLLGDTRRVAARMF
jgi:hypothetical protein